MRMIIEVNHSLLKMEVCSDRWTIGRQKQGHSVVETLKSGQWNWISLGEQLVWMKMGQVSIWSIASIIQDILSI